MAHLKPQIPRFRVLIFISKQTVHSQHCFPLSNPPQPFLLPLSCNLLFPLHKMSVSVSPWVCKTHMSEMQSTSNSWRACNIHECIWITHGFTLSIKYSNVSLLSKSQVCYTKYLKPTTLTKEHALSHGLNTQSSNRFHGDDYNNT